MRGNNFKKRNIVLTCGHCDWSPCWVATIIYSSVQTSACGARWRNALKHFNISTSTWQKWKCIWRNNNKKNFTKPYLNTQSFDSSVAWSFLGFSNLNIKKKHTILVRTVSFDTLFSPTFLLVEIWEVTHSLCTAKIADELSLYY